MGDFAQQVKGLIIISMNESLELPGAPADFILDQISEVVPKPSCFLYI
jgi:hypothetical protein